MWKTEMTSDTEVHVYPLFDFEYHLLRETCRCSPTKLAQGVGSIFIHHSYDGRETFEKAICDCKVPMVAPKTGRCVICGKFGQERAQQLIEQAACTHPASVQIGTQIYCKVCGERI